MNARAAVRAGLVSVAIVLGVWVGVSAAFATSLSTMGTPDYRAGTIPLVVTADSDVTSVTFEYQATGNASHTVTAAEASTTFRYDLELRATTKVVARAYSGTSEVWHASTLLTISGLGPGKAVLFYRSNDLLRSFTHLKGAHANRAATITVQTRKRTSKTWSKLWSGAVDAAGDGAFELPDIGLPRGTFYLRVITRNAFGSRTSGSRYVRQLGAVPSFKRLVLVDKSARYVRVIVNGHVTYSVRCAIGMPWVPTPTGTFKLGKRHRTPNAVWGPWRLNLRRRRVAGSGAITYAATKFYIHGTNDPSSIGHMRSHGCVRLLNKNIRRLSTVIDGYMVVIRE